MDILIGENYKITSDTMNVILNRKYEKKQTGEPLAESEKFDYKPIGYYANMENACQALLTREINVSDADNLAELMDVITKCRDQITEATKGIKRHDNSNSESE